MADEQDYVPGQVSDDDDELVPDDDEAFLDDDEEPASEGDDYDDDDDEDDDGDDGNRRAPRRRRRRRRRVRRRPSGNDFQRRPAGEKSSTLRHKTWISRRRSTPTLRRRQTHTYWAPRTSSFTTFRVCGSSPTTQTGRCGCVRTAESFWKRSVPSTGRRTTSHCNCGARVEAGMYSRVRADAP